MVFLAALIIASWTAVLWMGVSQQPRAFIVWMIESSIPFPAILGCRAVSISWAALFLISLTGWVAASHRVRLWKHIFDILIIYALVGGSFKTLSPGEYVYGALLIGAIYAIPRGIATAIRNSKKA